MTPPLSPPLNLIFDLDGTLWDTCPACAVAWNRALQDHAIPYREISTEDMRGVAGLPHGTCIRTVFHDLVEDQHRLLESHTAKGDMDAIRELGGELYPGVPEGLEHLIANYPLYIVSNCQKGYIELFYEFSGLGRFFTDQECWGNTGRPKAENLRSLIVRNQLQNPVYIGDTHGDADAAEACGVPFLHAGWGYAEIPGARTFASFGQLADFLLELQ
ncbi:MAG: HAD family hydrolase [Candidatus Sericytochromatia bacterium]